MVEPVAVGEHLNSLVVLALPGAKMDPLENESSDEWKLQFVCPAEIQEKLVAPFAEFIRHTFRQGHVTPRPGEPKSPEAPYLDLAEACAYLRLTERQLKDLCRDQRITHARIDYRTFRF
jgi:hypothetical protein